MVIGTDCTVTRKSNYNAVVGTMAPDCLGRIRYNKSQTYLPVSPEINLGLFSKDCLNWLLVFNATFNDISVISWEYFKRNVHVYITTKITKIK